MTLRDYLRAIRERWRIITAATVIVVALGVLLTFSSTKKYQASADVFVASNSSSTAVDGLYGGAQFVSTQIDTFAAIVTAPRVLKTVITDNSNVGLNAQTLKSMITGSAPTGQNIVVITITAGDSTLAAQLANSTARAFITSLKQFTTPTGTKNPVSTVLPTLTGPAVAPSSPISPKPVLNITVAVLLGLLLGVVAAAVREILDNRVVSIDALASALRTTAMGTVVDDPKAERYPIAMRAGGHNIRAENFRQLRANLQFANVDSHPRVIAITSSVPSEGKTMVATNLAFTLAAAGFSVCLVDADLRRPSVAKVMGLTTSVGLTSLMINEMDLDDALQDAGSNVRVLTSGPIPPNPSEVLASSYFRDIIRSLLAKVDYVVLDTAPLLAVSDGSEVAALADGALLVARHKVTTDVQIKRARTTLAGVDAKILGVVLNRVPLTRSGEYGYTYYRRDDKAKEKDPAEVAKTGSQRPSADADAASTPRPGPDVYAGQ